ncbi:TRAP transporter large permease [Polaromonas sp.]|uniref:TRAP transporter large permease n=1 Tax=Polaromonas sp. TaxID=1869339 RepID=UPI00180844BE|nr:TRAP transporter large permease [Polaromonas sp.]NMM05119.1 TRAP transporter large permease [Polaromonas sp.]
MIAIVLFALLVLGVPVGIAFALIVMSQAKAWNIDLSALASIPYDTISSFPLLAVPLFLLGGELMNRGGLIRQLTAVCDMFLTWSRAPLGHIMIAASALMGAITGSSVATVAAIGGTVGKEMAGRGYPLGYTAALNASAGLLGVLIPPSIPLILYGSIVGVSITQLFLASTLPGIVMMIAFGIVHTILAKRVLPGGRESVPPAGFSASAPRGTPVTRKLSILTRSIPALMLPVLVLGGIYSGVFTPTEAAAIAALYALLVTVLGRMTKFSDLSGIFGRAALSSAAILVIIGFTSIFNRAMVLEQIPQAIATFATSFTDSAIVFLLVVNLVLLLVGMFMETNAATLLMGPLLAPAAAKFGIDPVHFAIILVTNIEIGLLTPPMAANLYVAARTIGSDLLSLLKHLGWFLFAALAVMATITYVPQLSLWYRYFL